MFNLSPTLTNKKIFYLKDLYRSEESFKYDLRIYNSISKTGFTIQMTDINPWISGITNQSTLISGSTTEFYSGNTHYLNSYSDLTFIFNNIIQISGVNYTFYSSTGLTSTKSCILNGNYIIAFNDNSGKIVVVNPSGIVITGFTFCSHPVLDLNIIPISTDRVVVGYYDTLMDISYLKEIRIVGSSITQYNQVMFYNGKANGIVINKISDVEFITTYRTLVQGIIQKVKISTDHQFSVGFPFVFNDDITLFSNSVYQNDNIVVIFYDLDDQLKVKNCSLYGDYIGIGLPQIIKSNYCYDLGIGKLDDTYVYISYYDGEDLIIYTSLLKIDNDITIIQNEIGISDWNEGLNLTTITDNQYLLSYMDSNFTGVYRYIDISGGTFEDIHCDYNEFDIDISHLDLRKLKGHSDYQILYNNVIVETGVLFIDTTPIVYNI